ncbi:MAG: aldo/keto reductase [Planctomycetota bacterium]|jgi:aryl-alcohol dehydrogenase-like predicted oxidoreductase
MTETTGTPATLAARRRFGRTGLEVSPLGFGGAPIGWMEPGDDTVGRLLNALLDRGVNVIDTAAMYRGSEQMIARAIGHRRDEFVLITKCGIALDEIDAPAWSGPLVTASIDRSLRHLGTDRVDVMLLHSCDLETLRRGEALGALVAARDAGKVRFAGYSGDNEAAAHAVTLDDVAVLQTSVNVCDQRNIDAVLPAARARDVGVMVKRPIANAAWKAIEHQYDAYRDYARPYHERFAAMDLRLDELGFEGDPGAVWPGVALRFTLGVEGVHTAIAGTTAPHHVDANLRAAAAGPLAPDVVARIRAAFRRADPDGDWEGLT